MREFIEKIGNLCFLFFIPSIYYLVNSVSFSSMSVTDESGFAKAIFFIGIVIGFRSLADRDSFEFVVYLFGFMGIISLILSTILFVGSLISGSKNPYVEAALVISIGSLSMARTAK